MDRIKNQKTNPMTSIQPMDVDSTNGRRFNQKGKRTQRINEKKLNQTKPRRKKGGNKSSKIK